jgi:hypothetical protein
LRLPAAAVLNEAQLAYGENRLTDALRLYKEAGSVAEADDLPVLNGLYLTSWRLGRQRDAAEAFRKIVAQGIETRQLPLKLLFRPARRCRSRWPTGSSSTRCGCARRRR